MLHMFDKVSHVFHVLTARVSRRPLRVSRTDCTWVARSVQSHVVTVTLYVRDTCPRHAQYHVYMPGHSVGGRGKEGKVVTWWGSPKSPFSFEKWPVVIFFFL